MPLFVSSQGRPSGSQHAHHHAASSASGVQVLVRVRPPLARELMYDSGVQVNPPHDIKVYNDAQEFSGRYHHVFGEDAPQAEVYEKVRDCVPLALNGYNSTIFAYGQTGTGKTFTMMGDDPSVEGGSPSAPQGPTGGPGIIPRAVKELFRDAKAKQDVEGAAIQVIVSYMEIYNDRLHDLLQPYKPGSSRDPADVNQKRALLEVREDTRGNTYVPNLLCVKVKSYKSVYQLIAKGNRNRAVRHTEMNQASSRSHAILQLVIEQWPNGGADGTVLRSKLNFVDLAGSERWNTSAYGWDGGPDLMGEERINEMTAINGSLSALGSVVAALTERRPHIPYRDSRLTHLLQDSLGGNCRTTVLATLSPSVDAFEESCSTLRFADRASAIANNPVVNASRDMGSVLALKEREIQRLRNMLSQLTAGGGTPGGGTGMLPALDGGDSSAAARLAEELEETRRALEMERALRTELLQRLHHHASVTNLDASITNLGPLPSTPPTAFDAAGASQQPRPGSIRSSAGSIGSGGAGGGVGGGVGGGTDFFRLSTPSTPLNPVPAHLSGSPGPGGAVIGTPSTVLTPTRHHRASGAPPLARSRSNVVSSSHGRLGSSGTGSGAGIGSAWGLGGSPGAPSPGGRRDARRLSFDEAIMSIKSQIISLSTQQERARMRARQPPPQRAFWGGLPPPPPPPPGMPLLPPQGAAPVAAASAASGNFNARTRATVGIYGNANGGGQGAGRQPHHQHPEGAQSQQQQQQQRRPPALTVAPGVVGSSALGGGASLTQIPSIEMTASPVGSDVQSPGSLHAATAPSQTRQQRQPQQLQQRQQQQRRDSSPPPVAGAAIAACGNGKEVGQGQGGGAAATGQPGRGRRKYDSGSDMEEEGVEVEEEEEEEVAVEDGGEEDGGEEEVPEEDERGEEAVGRGRQGSGRGGKGPRSSGGGGGGRGTGDGSDSGGGLSQLDQEEYEELMREAREALAKGKVEGQGQRAAFGAGRQTLAAAAPGAGAGGGGGRSSLPQASSAPSAISEGADGVGVAISGTGWGRNALLHKFTDADSAATGPGDGGGGALGFGRSSFLAAAAATAPVTASPPGVGGWGRKSILAAQSVPAAAPLPPPPAEPSAAAVGPTALTGTGRRAMVAELMAENDDGSGPYGKSPLRGGRAAGGGGGRSRSKSVGGRPSGGSRGNAADRVAKLDAGSWIYILGASASSTRAKHLASALQMDPRTGLPAI